MGWFSDLFNRKPYGPDIAFNCNVPMPKVKAYNEDQSGVILPKGAKYVPPKDISEPVYAIGKAMKERPSSFKVRYKTDIVRDITYSVATYQCKDLKMKQEVNISSGYGYDGFVYASSWKWLTSDEICFLVDTYTEIYKDKQNRLKNIQRAAMKVIYQ